MFSGFVPLKIIPTVLWNPPDCMKPLADYLGVTVEEAAKQILNKSYEKVSRSSVNLQPSIVLKRSDHHVGVGRAAALPYSAKAMNISYISQVCGGHLINRIALAMIRDVVEHNSKSDNRGYLPYQARGKGSRHKEQRRSDTVECRLRSIPDLPCICDSAWFNEVQATDLSLRCDTESKKIAADSMRAAPESRCSRK